MENLSEKTSVATRKPGGILLHIRVQPKSAATSMAGLHGDALKIRLTAPPADGAANRMCLKFLAKQLGLPPSNLEIVSGHTARHKQVFIQINETLPAESDRQAAAILKKIATWAI